MIEDEEAIDERGRRLAFLLLTDRFKRSARAANFGCVDDGQALENAGLRALTRIVGDLDLLFGVPAPEALVPLLEDPDPVIRVCAAGYLLETKSERALAVLRDLNAHAPPRCARRQARFFGITRRAS